MFELLRTNDPVVISVVESLLASAEIPYYVADRGMSVLEGSINAIQMRVLVPEEWQTVARKMLADNDLGGWLRG